MMENYSNDSDNIINDKVSQQERSDANTGSDQIGSNAQNIPTFGVGGQTSHVVDPEFRQPAPPQTPTVPTLLFDPNPRGLFGSSFYAQQPQQTASNVTAYTASGSNIYSSSNLFVTTPTTTSVGSAFTTRDPSSSNDNKNNNNINNNFSNQQTSQSAASSSGIPQLSFTMHSSATSFSDLARRNNATATTTASNPFTSTSTASTSTASMLHEYGPPPSFTPTSSPRKNNTTQGSQDNSHGFNNTSGQGYNLSGGSMPKPSIVTTPSSTFVTSTTTSANTPYIPPTSGQTSHSSSHASKNSSTSVPAYSPPPPTKPKSPPLDEIPSLNKSAGEVILESAQNKSGKIPKRTVGANSSNDKYESMDLITLQKAYRCLETDKMTNLRKRQEVERVINDLTRGTQGQNLELSPHFRAKKEELKKLNNCSADIEENMRKIDDRLSTKFDYKIEPRVNTKSNPMKRAKMSTAAPAHKVDMRPGQSRDSRFQKLLLDFSDSRTWCEDCDRHFESVKEFCNHLHHRDHIRAVKNSSSPWRSKRDLIDKRKTYDLIKSVCARVSRSEGLNFTTTHLEKALYPDFEKTGKSSKERSLGRERSIFQSDDQLFTMKGYNYLMPITGYYCKLCDQCLCDYTDVEQHLKGHDHLYKHVECIALNPNHEKRFRTKMEKSYKLQFPDETDEIEVSQPPTKKATTSSGSGHDGFKVPQYKKPTSHIVDEHEVVADKFTSRPERATKAKRWEADSNTERTEQGSPSRIKSKRTFDTEIVPLGDTRKPSALKRLRNEASSGAYNNTQNKNKRRREEEDAVVSTKARSSPDEIVIVSDDEGPVDKTDNTDTLLDSGDPENPFPELELRVLGNHSANILKDPRLAAPCSVVLTKIDLEDFEEELNDAATLWTRVHKMLAKKEKGEKLGSKFDLHEKRRAKPVYFDANDELVPIDCDEDEEEGKKSEFIKEEKPKISESEANALSNDRTGQKNGKDKDNEDKGNKMAFESVSDSDDSDAPKKAVDMSFIEDFFCEK